MCNPADKLDLILTELRTLNHHISGLHYALRKPVISGGLAQRASTIRAIQLELGIPADGVIGPQTRAALRELGF